MAKANQTNFDTTKITSNQKIRGGEFTMAAKKKVVKKKAVKKKVAAKKKK